jgi:hypothetical protein
VSGASAAAGPKSGQSSRRRSIIALIFHFNLRFYQVLQLLVTKAGMGFPIDKKAGCFADIERFSISKILVDVIFNSRVNHIFSNFI